MKKLLMLVCVLCFSVGFAGNSYAASSCRDIEFVYARGSGAARNDTDE